MTLKENLDNFCSVLQNFSSESHSRPVLSDDQVLGILNIYLWSPAYMWKSVRTVIGLNRWWLHCDVSDHFYYVILGSTCCKSDRLNRRKKDFFKVGRAKWSSEEVWKTFKWKKNNYQEMASELGIFLNITILRQFSKQPSSLVSRRHFQAMIPL